MLNRRPPPPAGARSPRGSTDDSPLPRASLQFRLKSWRRFQQALDPFAPPKPLSRRAAAAALSREATHPCRAARGSRRARARRSIPSRPCGSAERLLGFCPSSSASARSASSIADASHGSTAASRSAPRRESRCRARPAARSARRGSGRSRDTRRTSRSSPARSAPSRARARRATRCPARGATEQVERVLVRLQVTQVDAVHPVELLVVEGRRARHDALQREALEQFLARHDRRLVVVAPAKQREEVEQRGGQVALVAEVVERDRVAALRQLATVGTVDVRHVRVRREVSAERAKDVDLRRRVRYVVLTTNHVRDPVGDVVDRRDEVVGRPTVGTNDHEVG